MRDDIVSVSLFLLALIQLTSGCNLWCRKPMSFEYFCCEDGNPFTDSKESSSTTTSQPVPSESPTKATTTTNLSTQPPSACRYFCVYGSEKVYCCDDGTKPLPDDHDPHEGRCAAKMEQVCKKGGIYLHVHSRKIRTTTGGSLLSAVGTDAYAPTCASDGYCPDHEKCCENRCAKKHTCMRAVFDYDGAKRTVTKKKTKSKF